MVSVAESSKIECDAELNLVLAATLAKSFTASELFLNPTNQVTLPISFHLALLALSPCGRIHLPLYI